MKKVEIVLGDGKTLDVAKEFGMGLNYSIEDISDPSKRNSSFSKTIVLAGTKNNNEILGYLFDINSDFTFFNPNFKLDAKILVDETVVLDGFLQLRKINKEDEGNTIFYDVVIYENAVDLFSVMGEKLLTDLDFSSLNHTYNHTNISASWTNTSTYVYPIFYKNSKTYQTQDFKPAIFLKDYIIKIADSNGFSLGGSFLDDPIFTKEIIPYNGGQPTIPETEAISREFNANFDPSTTEVQISSFIRSTKGIINTNFNYTFLDDKDDPFNRWTELNNSWTVSDNGSYNLKTVMGFRLKAEAASGTWLREDSNAGGDSPIETSIEMTAFRNGVKIGETLVSTNSGGLPFNDKHHAAIPPSNQRFPAFGLFNTTSHTFNMDIDGTFFEKQVLNAGDVITFKIKLLNPEGTSYVYATKLDEADGVPVNVTYTLYTRKPAINGSKESRLYNESIRGFLTDQDEMEMNNFIPLNVKQKDLFTDIIKRYNLIITSNPLNPKNILLNTRDSFYASGDDTLDWSNKRDLTYNEQIELLSELQSKKINFQYKKGKDKKSSDYEKAFSGLIYGSKEIEFTNEFVKGEKKITSIYSSTPLLYNSVNKEMIVPNIDTQIPKTNIKVLLYDGLIPTLNGTTWFFDGISSLGADFRFVKTTYPYAGHWDNPINPIFDNHFNSILTLDNGDVKAFESYDELITTTNNNLFNRNWSNYINQIDDGKLVTMRLNLTENDINDVKDNFETQIFIDDAYYLIDTIQDYDPTKDAGLTIIKLLKTRAALTFSPTTTTGGSNTNGGIDGVNDPSDISAERGSYLTTDETVNQTIFSQHVISVGDNNFVGEDSENININGDRNTIGTSVSNSGILGSTDSSIASGVRNSFIIGVNQKHITRDNEIWLGNLHIIDGTIVSEWNVLQGGRDELGYPKLFATNPFNLIQGGKDELRDPNFIHPQNLIQGGKDKL